MDAADFKVGDRVELVRMDDEYRDCSTHIGTEGTVIGVCPKPINVLNVDWDDGFGLNPCLDVDVVRKVGDVRGGREFFSVSTLDGWKWVKYQGFTWSKSDGEFPYTCTTVDDCYFCIGGGNVYSNSERMAMLAERRRQYQEDMSEREFFRCNSMFYGSRMCGEHLHVDDVDENTPDGDYWFESGE